MNFVNSLRRRFAAKPENPPFAFLPDDTFLVSYPKSGNTWVRFIIANLLRVEGDEIDFHTVVRYVPEYGLNDDVLDGMPSPRVIKSHNLYTQTFPRVIYIVRDPRDVYVSYYHYLRKKLAGNTDFSSFLRKPDLYPSRWHVHVDSWLSQPSVGLVVRYEDLLQDAYMQSCKIAEFLSPAGFGESNVMRAVEASTFHAMKAVEVERGRPFLTEDAAATATTFVRKGQEGDWKKFFSEEDLEFLLDEAGPTMQELGYAKHCC